MADETADEEQYRKLRRQVKKWKESFAEKCAVLDPASQLSQGPRSRELWSLVTRHDPG